MNEQGLKRDSFLRTPTAELPRPYTKPPMLTAHRKTSVSKSKPNLIPDLHDPRPLTTLNEPSSYNDILLSHGDVYSHSPKISNRQRRGDPWPRVCPCNLCRGYPRCSVKGKWEEKTADVTRGSAVRCEGDGKWTSNFTIRWICNRRDSIGLKRKDRVRLDQNIPAGLGIDLLMYVRMAQLMWSQTG